MSKPKPQPATYHKLKGLLGIAYSCAGPSNTYCDDWYTSQYEQVFDNGPDKRSLQHLEYVGFNHVRTYYLQPNADHSAFLTLSNTLKLSIEIGISNNLLDTRDATAITALVNATKSYNCVKLYLVGNEYTGDVSNVIWGIELVRTLCTQNITYSSIFDANFASAKSVYTELSASAKEKYIVGINMYFYENTPADQGNVLQSVINNYYNDPVLQDSYLYVSEYGRNDNNYQALQNFLWGHNAASTKFPNYLGVSLFSYTDESWKGSANGENSYGIINEQGIQKDLYNCVLGYFMLNKPKKL